MGKGSLVLWRGLEGSEVLVTPMMESWKVESFVSICLCVDFIVWNLTWQRDARMGIYDMVVLLERLYGLPNGGWLFVMGSLFLAFGMPFVGHLHAPRLFCLVCDSREVLTV